MSLLGRIINALVVVSIVCSTYGAYGTEVPSGTKSELQIVYASATAYLKKNSSYYREHANSEKNDFEIDVADKGGEPKAYILSGDAHVQVWAEPLRFKSYLNKPLKRYLDKQPPAYDIPTIDLGEAIDRALQYQADAGIVPEPDLNLTTVSFDKGYSACWEIRWTRAVKAYSWDDFSSQYFESRYVIFHETFGILGIGGGFYLPVPQSLVVKLNRQEAITKASKYIPLVERSLFYLQARKDGFVASEVKSCELKIAVPNWLLDPTRATWISEKPPEETRLCWVVRFTTIDTKAEERGLKNKEGKPLNLIPPDILIYLDAATGECVGANFT